MAEGLTDEELLHQFLLRQVPEYRTWFRDMATATQKSSAVLAFANECELRWCPHCKRWYEQETYPQHSCTRDPAPPGPRKRPPGPGSTA